MKSSLPGNCRSYLCASVMSNYTAVTALFTERLKPAGRDLFSLLWQNDQQFEECPWRSLSLRSRRAWEEVNGPWHCVPSAFLREVFTGRRCRFGSLLWRMERYLQENNLFRGFSVPVLPAEPGAFWEYTVKGGLRYKICGGCNLPPVAGELMIYWSTLPFLLFGFFVVGFRFLIVSDTAEAIWL